MGPGRGGRPGGEIDVDRAHGKTTDQAILAKRNCLHLCGSWKRSKHDVASLRHVPGNIGPLCTTLEVLGGRCRMDVVHSEGMASGKKVERHGATHIAKADEANTCLR